MARLPRPPWQRSAPRAAAGRQGCSRAPARRRRRRSAAAPAERSHVGSPPHDLPSTRAGAPRCRVPSPRTRLSRPPPGAPRRWRIPPAIPRRPPPRRDASFHGFHVVSARMRGRRRPLLGGGLCWLRRCRWRFVLRVGLRCHRRCVLDDGVRFPPVLPTTQRRESSVIGEHGNVLRRSSRGRCRENFAPIRVWSRSGVRRRG